MEEGIYLFDGTSLARVADLTTLIPGGTGPFTGFSAPVLSGANVAFRGSGEPGKRGSTYSMAPVWPAWRT